MSVALGASASASAVVLSHKVALVLTIVMLAFSTGSFAYNAQQRRGYGPLLLCLFAAPLLLSNPVINLLEVRRPPRAPPRPCARCTRACCLLLPAHLTRRHPDLALFGHQDFDMIQSFDPMNVFMNIITWIGVLQIMVASIWNASFDHKLANWCSARLCCGSRGSAHTARASAPQGS